MLKWGTALAAMFLTLPALAQMNEIVTTATITNSSSCTALPQNNFRKSLTIDATGASQNIGYCEGACTAAIGTAGTTTLTAGALDYWPAGSAPKAAFCFIAVSGNQPLTIREGQ